MRHTILTYFICWCFCIIVIGCSENHQIERTKFSVNTKAFSLKESPLLLIHDSSDRYDMCYHQTVTALNYAKIPFVEFDLAQKMKMPALANYPALVVVTESLWNLGESESRRVKKYVSDGGGLAVLFRTWNEYLPDLFGVTNREEPQFIEQEQSIVFEEEFLPGGAGLILEEEDVSNYDFRIQNNAKIIAETPQYPLVWFHEFGSGKVIYWNTSILASKVNRGFIVRSVAAVQPFTVAGLANVAIFDLDDYPNASYNEKLEPIKSEFDMTISEFYVLKWYPDLVKFAKEYGVRYTAALIFNYNGLTKPPFKFYEWLNGQIKIGGKTVTASVYAAQNLGSITELALHGYNHQSLSAKFWDNFEYMRLSLKAGKKRWQIENLGELPKSYIPPLNIYDSTGVTVLSEVFPSIEQIGALYLGSFEMGQFREFGPEPWKPELYVIPRNTSGCIFTEFYRRSMISLLNCNGVWVHFIHPDDVYPTGERYDREELSALNIKELTWHGESKKDGLYFQLKKWIEFAQSYYPYLRFVKRVEALPIMKMFDQTKFRATNQRNILNVETNVVPSYFSLYLSEENELEGVLGCELVHEHQTPLGTHLILRANDFIMMLQFNKSINEKVGL